MRPSTCARYTHCFFDLSQPLHVGSSPALLSAIHLRHSPPELKPASPPGPGVVPQSLRALRACQFEGPMRPNASPSRTSQTAKPSHSPEHLILRSRHRSQARDTFFLFLFAALDPPPASLATLLGPSCVGPSSLSDDSLPPSKSSGWSSSELEVWGRCATPLELPLALEPGARPSECVGSASALIVRCRGMPS